MAAYRESRNGQPTNGYASDHHSSLSGSEEAPNFIVEHLATFTVSPQNGVVYPADGMRRLLQMEKTSGIWTQKMVLRLEHPWVVILDHENGDVVEKFPVALIRDPTAFTSKDPRDMYNNIFIFVVAEDPINQIPPEMHIFQCVRVSATEVVEDMKNFISGKIQRSPGNRIPPPPDNPPPEPPANGPRETSYPRGTLNDDASSTTSERYERDVSVLNRCFDDIERFIARLQVAAAAGRELDRRRKSRKSKKKETGDGMLSMRAKLPTEVEFIDILQKFKLSFILLAKLKSHIHDPNAPELVHFLFSPLSLIVEASQDPSYTPLLPSRVISPLLTQDAIELLTNCLTSKETELWNSLGDPWLIPKEKWNGYVVPYVPVFTDGWSPDPSYFLDDKDTKQEAKRSNPPESSRHSSEYYDSDRGANSSPPFDASRRSASPSADRRSDISSDSIEKSDDSAKFERAQKQWFAELKARDAKIVQVTYPRTANNDKELSVIRGEYLEVLDDSRKWWKARNVKGKVGHVPNTIVTPLFLDDDDNWGTNTNGRQNRKEDSSEEDTPVVLRKKVVERDPKKTASTVSIPPPPPPMPKEEAKSRPTTANSVPKSNPSLSRTPSQQDLMFDELKSVLDQFSQRSKVLDIRKTPEAYISSNASPAEVQQWLKAKEFDESIQKRLKGMNGTELFALRKDQLEKFFGKDEGHRLYSQLTIQRNTSGYKTTRSSELRAALDRARKRAEAEEAARNAANQRNKNTFADNSD